MKSSRVMLIPKGCLMLTLQPEGLRGTLIKTGQRVGERCRSGFLHRLCKPDLQDSR